MQKRLNFFILVVTMLFVVLSVRILYFQTLKREDFTYQVVRQRAIDTTIKIVRGNIYDRNMIPFTNVEEKVHVIVVPNLIKDIGKTIEILSALTEVDKDELKSKLEVKTPLSFVVDDMNIKDIESTNTNPGIKVFKLNKRYGEKSFARHLIGYVNAKDQSGVSGLEKIFNKQLSMDKYQNIAMIGDAVKRFIPGLGYRVTNYMSESQYNGVKLTIDFHIQRIIEEMMDKEIEDGAVVLSDVLTGDILGIASRPNYSQNKIEEHLKSKGSELVNKAFNAYDIGSVFKIVVAAAALEGKVVSTDDMFHCTGFIEVDGMSFGCFSKQNGHGDINFSQAFAQSCNSAFIDVGLKTGYEAIINMAQKFGLGSRVKILDGLEQQSGHMPIKKYVSLREVSNISIGQGEILVTPVQVVDIITTIANQGVRKKINIADAVVSDAGDAIETIKGDASTRVISANTAREIKKMMNEVTITGTGIKANLDEFGGAGGKTGSAETGWIIDGEAKVHAWFAGYFPADNPRYAMVVFKENGRQGGSAAAPVFRKIAEAVIKLNRE